MSTTAAWMGSELLAVVTYEHILQIPCAKPCTYADTISSPCVLASWAPGQTSWHVLQAAMPKAQAYMPTYMAHAIWAGRELDHPGRLRVPPRYVLPSATRPRRVGPVL